MAKLLKLSEKQNHWLDLLVAMTKKEVKVRYKRAILGFLWIVLNPLLQILIMGFIFQFFVSVKVDNYFLFLLVGLLPWNFFSRAISRATSAIIYERSLIQKAKFPREVIVLSIVLSEYFHLLISLTLLIGVLIVNWLFIEHSLFLNFHVYVWRLLRSMISLIWLLFLTSGLSLLTSALNVKRRDVNFIIQAIMPLWFYVTPIVYTVDLIPTRFRFLLYLNPITIIIEEFHQSLLNLPSAGSDGFISLSLLVSVILIVVGGLVFSRESKHFDDWI